MALEAPSHRKRLCMIYNFHLVDLTMALDATYATADVNSVIKVGIIRNAMQPHPGDRVTCGPGFAHGGQLGTLCFDVAQLLPVAVVAGLGVRHVGEIRFLYMVVTVATIQAEMLDVQEVTERNGLIGHISYTPEFRSGIIGDGTYGKEAKHRHSAGEDEEVCPRLFWEDLWHGRKPNRKVAPGVHNAQDTRLLRGA